MNINCHCFPSRKKKDADSATLEPDWDTADLLSDCHNVSHADSKNIIRLFKEENTIPFLCRYRRELIGHRTPEEMRDIQESILKIENLRSKIQSSIKNLDKSGKLDETLKRTILSLRSLEELDLIYGPYKVAKTTLAEKARTAGLEKPAIHILVDGQGPLDLQKFICHSKAELESVDKISDGIKYIGSDLILKSPEIIQHFRTMAKDPKVIIISKKAAGGEAVESADKFENYFDVSYSIVSVQPHQILAMNRGENLKVLAVKIKIPEFLESKLKYFVRNSWFAKGAHFKQRTDLFEDVWKYCYAKKIEPLVGRLIRSSLKDRAEKSSIEVFAKNLKELLLSPPVKGSKILGIDPGFRHGSKCALISEQSSVLDTAVLMMGSSSVAATSEERKLSDLMRRHQCTLIALGNGKGCREIEKLIAGMIERRKFHSQEVKYCIVNEQGASIYSCSDEARAEFPDLDINLISAVSIARRLNDPLAEYVKIEPKHLGVGMYQHDMPEKDLSRALDEVVSECVSRVGVDLNTASECLLRRISGLTQARSKKIIEYREKHGPFKCRSELTKVPSIGEKTFTQCAGFIRIERNTSGGQAGNKKFNEFDMTWLHPESYAEATKVLKKLNLLAADIGTSGFVRKVRGITRDEQEALASNLKIQSGMLKSIFEALSRDVFKDYRDDIGKVPQFKSSIQKMSDLRVGELLTGVITNVTHFGLFVDIGVEKDALIHVSKLNNHKPGIGCRVEVKVLSLDIGRQRINLNLEMVL